MTNSNWKKYFEKNQTHFDWLHEANIDKLSADEVDLIYSSLQQFQKGEHSEGKHLIHFTKCQGDDEYLAAIKLFIKEEERHALALGEFMKANDIPKIKEHWIDNVFRGLRVLAGLENSIAVLLTAEIVAAVYYQALREATKSRSLIRICDQLLKDEEKHIDFQSETLHHFFNKKSMFNKCITRMLRKFLMLGTTFVVWLAHGKVLQAGGYSFSRFLNAIFDEYRRSNFIIKYGQTKKFRFAGIEH